MKTAMAQLELLCHLYSMTRRIRNRFRYARGEAVNAEKYTTWCSALHYIETARDCLGHMRYMKDFTWDNVHRLNEKR